MSTTQKSPKTGLVKDSAKAIIYCAENTISGKKYIGKTIRSLENRIQEHFRKTVKYDYKFSRALKCYPCDSWQWSILAEVDIEKANEYERFFISDLDTYSNGYNSTPGGEIDDAKYSPTYNPEICHVYHPLHGTISGTRSELANQYPELLNLRKLISDNRKQLSGWVLAENKDSYAEFTQHRKPKSRKTVTLYHKKHGTLCLQPRDFVARFNLTYPDIAHLSSKRQKTCKGWTLVEEE